MRNTMSVIFHLSAIERRTYTSRVYVSGRENKAEGLRCLPGNDCRFIGYGNGFVSWAFMVRDV